jgi:hypothetical protein
MFSGPDYPALSEVSDYLDKAGEGNRISVINWEGYSKKPEIKFNIGYSDNEIFLKYYVKEDCIKAEMISSNQKVYEDSCVEFFVSPGEDGTYYNFEFNSIGTCLLGIGTGRADRSFADPGIISKIRRLPSMGTVPFGERCGDFFWTLTIAIQFGIFIRHEVKDLKNKILRANFYKCGDNLSSPHFITWNPVKTGKPDFHQPVFFGQLRFI